MTSSTPRGEGYVPGSGSNPELLVAATGSNPELLVSLAGEDSPASGFGSTPELSQASAERPRPVAGRPTNLEGPIPHSIPPPPPSPRLIRQKQLFDPGSQSPPAYPIGRSPSPLLPKPGQGAHTLPKSPLAFRKPLQQQHSLPATLLPPAPCHTPPLSPLLPRPSPSDPPLEPIKLGPPSPQRSPLMHHRQLSDASDPRGRGHGPPMLINTGRTMSMGSGQLLHPDYNSPGSPPVLQVMPGLLQQQAHLQQQVQVHHQSGMTPAGTTGGLQGAVGHQNAGGSVMVDPTQQAQAASAGGTASNHVTTQPQWMTPPTASPSLQQPPPSSSPNIPGLEGTSAFSIVTPSTSAQGPTPGSKVNPFLGNNTATTLLLDELEKQQTGYTGERSRSYTVGAGGPVRPIAIRGQAPQLGAGGPAQTGAQSIGDFTAFDITGQTSSVRYPWQRDIGIQCELLSDSSSNSSQSLGSKTELRSSSTQTKLSHLSSREGIKTHKEEPRTLKEDLSNLGKTLGVMRAGKEKSSGLRLPPMHEPMSRKPLFGSDGRLTCAFNTCRRDSPAYAPLATEDNDSSPDESLWDE